MKTKRDFHTNPGDEMRAAIAHAQAHGGKLMRFTGGFWSDKDWKEGQRNFRVRVIFALVAHRHGYFSKMERCTIRRDYCYRVEFTLGEDPKGL